MESRSWPATAICRAQFLNARTNHREDEYGGSFDNRLRFIRDVAASIRAHAPPELIVGTRISSNEYDVDGFGDDDTLPICRELRETFDYFNVIAGTSASSSGAVHIAPPMTVKNAYIAPFAQKLRQAIGKPVFVAGRINQPHQAEEILAAGCGRHVRHDPRHDLRSPYAAKARDGRVDDIRACIGCNQACIGHAQLGLSISCIQYPETGRELAYGVRPRHREATQGDGCRRWACGNEGGGRRGRDAAHDVTLYEADRPGLAARRCWRSYCPIAPNSAASSPISPARWSWPVWLSG